MELNKSSKIHCTVTVVFLHWQQALHIFKASDVTPFTCKYKNIAPSQREITCLFSCLCGLPTPLFPLSDSRLECSSLTNRRNDLKTSYLVSKVLENALFKKKEAVSCSPGRKFLVYCVSLQSYGFPILPEATQGALPFRIGLPVLKN